MTFTDVATTFTHVLLGIGLGLGFVCTLVAMAFFYGAIVSAWRRKYEDYELFMKVGVVLAVCGALLAFSPVAVMGGY